MKIKRLLAIFIIATLICTTIGVVATVQANPIPMPPPGNDFRPRFAGPKERHKTDFHIKNFPTIEPVPVGPANHLKWSRQPSLHPYSPTFDIIVTPHSDDTTEATLALEVPDAVEEEKSFSVHVYDPSDGKNIAATISFNDQTKYGSNVSFTAPSVSKDTYKKVSARKDGWIGDSEQILITETDNEEDVTVEPWSPTSFRRFLSTSLEKRDTELIRPPHAEPPILFQSGRTHRIPFRLPGGHEGDGIHVQ